MEAPDTDDLRQRLEAIAEELADLTLDALRAQATGDLSGAAVERRLAKARRAVERAAAALGPADADVPNAFE